MHAYFAPSDLLSWNLLRETFGRDFLWTVVAEAAVFVLILTRHGRTRRQWSFRSRGVRLEGLRRPVAPGWWLVPIYIWAYEGHLKMVSVLDAYSTGLVSPPFSWVVLGLYEILLALACLAVVQTLLVAVTGGQAASLGVEGNARVGATAAVLAVTTDTLLYLGASRWFEKAAAGAL